MERLFCIPSFTRLLQSLSLLLLSACTQEESLPVRPDSPTPVEVTFTLTTLGGGETRIYDKTDAGNAFENAIDMENIHILLFDADNDTYLDTFKPSSVTRSGNTYEVVGELSQPYENFKVVVLANWPEDAYPTPLEEGKTTIENICSNATYNYKTPFTLSANNLIPMYGVRTFTDISLTPDIREELGKIDLLRAMCKIEVTCSDENYLLTGVTLHRYATKGMCAPTEVYDNTADDWKDSEEVHLPDDINTNIEENLNLVDNGKGSFIVYVPEIENNKTEEGEHSYLTVTLASKNNPEDELYIENPNIYFRDYTEDGQVDEKGGSYDLIRNHWYQFKITGVSGVDLEFVVLSWDEVNADVTFN